MFVSYSLEREDLNLGKYITWEKIIEEYGGFVN